ncbi:RNA-guided endonuclease InsQ/TnpB family protein [Streptomyces sp. NPDC003395]
MHLRYNFRLYPTVGQEHSLAVAFGCARTVYNDGVSLRRKAHAEGLPYPTLGDLQKKLITEAKKTPEREWLSRAAAAMLQNSLRDLETAYRGFIASVSGKRRAAKVGPPRFKSRKDTRQSIRFTGNAHRFVTAGGKLQLPKIGDITVRWSRRLPSAPSSVTVIKDSAGRYFASFVVQVEPTPLPETDSQVGIDLGLEHFAVLSDGTKISSPRFLRRAEKKLRRASRELSRKQKGSKNREKARQRLARAHAQVTDARRDFHHQLSTALIRENQAIAVEDLPVKALAKSPRAKSVRDAGWTAFLTMLEYKAARYGRTLLRAGRFEPTSQVCSQCGVKDGPKPLKVRAWSCPSCGALLDRDINAAINIAKAAGLAVAACGAQVRPGLVPAQRGEAGTHPKHAILPDGGRREPTLGGGQTAVI